MRDEPRVIQTEVGRLLVDVRRLGDRVEKLDQHFRQAGEDVAQIRTSAEKIVKRGDRIEALVFDDAPAQRGWAAWKRAGIYLRRLSDPLPRSLSLDGRRRARSSSVSPSRASAMKENVSCMIPSVPSLRPPRERPGRRTPLRP